MFLFARILLPFMYKVISSSEETLKMSQVKTLKTKKKGIGNTKLNE